MILTTCAACAAPLSLAAPRCVRCQTRYCGSDCQHDHWRRGHKQICKKIHRGGNAEQYHADKKYKEAVAVAVEACAEDTKGQKCYICLEAVHSRTGEGLVRGCACGDRDGVSSPELGVAHVSCLMEQAKILSEEAAEGRMDDTATQVRWKRWHTCDLCGQAYHGVVHQALGWACWKTYCSRPEVDIRISAMTQLGNGLYDAGHQEDALAVREAELSMKRRGDPTAILAQGNIAISYYKLGRFEDALRIKRDVYLRLLKLYGEDHCDTIDAATNLTASLVMLKRFQEARLLLRKMMPVARRVYGERDHHFLNLTLSYAMAFYHDHGSTISDLHVAVKTLEDLELTARRVLCSSHPLVERIGEGLRESRAVLRAREALLAKYLLYAASALAIAAFAWSRRSR